MTIGFAGAFSRRAADKANRKLGRMRNGMAALRKDEGGAQRAEIPAGEINHPTNQGKRRFGSVSRSGGIRGAESQERANHINKPENARRFPAGSGMSAANRNQANTRAKGPVAPCGPLYGGGGRNTQ